jgi:predicted RNase H-like HicB family nuclease
MKAQMKMIQTAKGEYRAWCPMLPGCEVHSLSSSDARKKLIEAAQGYLASLDVAGNELELDSSVSAPAGA